MATAKKKAEIVGFHSSGWTMRSQIFCLMRSCPVLWDTAFLEGMHSSVPAGILFCQNQTEQ